MDDDAEVRAAMQGFARSLGLHAIAFGSGRALLDSPDLPRVGCVVTDLRMPGMCGIELQQELRARGLRVGVVLVSAFATPAMRQRSIAAGAVELLPKPFATEDMIACLRRALGGAGDIGG